MVLVKIIVYIMINDKYIIIINEFEMKLSGIKYPCKNVCFLNL